MFGPNWAGSQEDNFSALHLDYLAVPNGLQVNVVSGFTFSEFHPQSRNGHRPISECGELGPRAISSDYPPQPMSECAETSTNLGAFSIGVAIPGNINQVRDWHRKSVLQEADEKTPPLTTQCFSITIKIANLSFDEFPFADLFRHIRRWGGMWSKGFPMNQFGLLVFSSLCLVARGTALPIV